MFSKLINLLIVGVGLFLIRQAYILLLIPSHIHTFVTVFYPYLSTFSFSISIEHLLHQIRVFLVAITIVAAISLILQKTIRPALLCQCLLLMGKIGHMKLNMTIIHHHYIEIGVLLFLMLYQRGK